jgi:hypothetical protein
MKCDASTFDLLEDVGGFRGPDEWFGMFIVAVDVFADSCDQLLHAAEGATPEAVFSQVAEEALHHIEPGAAGGSEVHMEPGMASEPALDLGMFVGGIVVHNHVDLLIFRHHVVDSAEEFQPLLVTMPIIAHRDHLSLQSIQCRKQGGCAVALVVVSHGAGAPLLHRKAWLGSIQSLNLALLVGAKHDGVFGRVQIQAHDIFQLLDEVRIIAELEASHQMRLQSVGVPDAANAGFADAGRLRHGARRPVRGVDRLLLQRHFHESFHLTVGDGAGLARSRCVLMQSRDATFQKAPSPPRRCLRHDAHTARNLFILQSRRGHQYDPSPLYHASWLGSRSPQPLQGCSLFRVQHNRRRRPHGVRPPIV